MFKKSHSRSSSRSDNSEFDIPIGKMQPAKQALQQTVGSASAKTRSRTSSEGGSQNSTSYRPYQSSSLTRTVNPMNYPLDNLTALSMALSGNSPYSADNLAMPGRQAVHGKSSSSNSSPSNHGGRTSSLQNVSSRDRSLERLEREYLIMGDRSLDRHGGLDRIQLVSRDGSTTSLIDTRRGYNHGRDRSLDREYPHMGARSLERDHHITSRSRSSDRSDYDTMSSSLVGGSLSPQEYRNSFMFDLQVQITELHKECAKLQKELDATNAKLCSSMNSIKTFWSPELKKERTIRKDETARYVMLNEQYRIAQAEIQKKNDIIRQLESRSNNGEIQLSIHEDSSQDSDSAGHEKDKQAKEILILQKTVDEMELRIETQKQTLSARDESIKKLLEMLQSKGLSVKQFDDNRQEIDNLRTKMFEGEKKIKHLESCLEQKDSEITKLKENQPISSDSGLSLSSSNDNTHTMQAIIEAKDSRIAALEQEIQAAEDKQLKMQEESFMMDRRDGTSSKDTQSAKEKELRAELEKVRNKLSEKETKLEGLRLKVETCQRQQAEKEQYVTVLKEQISAKELHSSMLQADIEDLKDRVKDKEGTIERKSRQSQSFNKDKRKLESDMLELRDQLDIKDRKINVLNRKIENLEASNKEKDEQLDLAKARNLAIFTDSNDSAISTLEQSLADKEKQIERLKEQRDQVHKDHQEETELFDKNMQDMKCQLEKLHQELNSKQTELCELREEVAELKSEKFQHESKIRQLEADLAQKREELEKMDKQAEEGNQEVHSKEQTETSEKQLMQLQGSIEQSQNEAVKAQKEVDRLTEELKKTEADGKEKDDKIKELNDIVKEYKTKMGTLKRNQQSEKKKNAQLLEEAWKREVNLNEDSSQLLSEVDVKSNRIEELEEALRESVRITAEREMDMAEQQQLLEETKSKVTELKTEIEALQQGTTDSSGKISSLNKLLEEKDVKLRKLQAERFKHMEEVFEMKQEAIQAAISEKDANIALLEMTSTKTKRNTEEIGRLNKEKEKLQQRLKDVTQNRIKLASKDDKGKERKKLQPQKPRQPEKVDPYQLTAPDPSLLES